MPDDVFRWIVAIGVGLSTLAFLIQAILTFRLYQAVRRSQAKLNPLVDRAEPILENTRKLLDENIPRIMELSADAVAIAKDAREQTVRLGDLVRDASARAKERIAQIDEAVGVAVIQVEEAGEAVKFALVRPVREVAGLLSGMRAALVTLAQGGRRESVDHATQDEEMFI